MEKVRFRECLGLVVYLLYYNKGIVREDKSFDHEFSKKLGQICELELLKDMKTALNMARKHDDYSLDVIKSPLQSFFTKKEIKYFFDKFYFFLIDYLDKT